MIYSCAPNNFRGMASYSKFPLYINMNGVLIRISKVVFKQALKDSNVSDITGTISGEVSYSEKMVIINSIS